MNIIAIVAILGGLYFLLEKNHASISAGFLSGGDSQPPQPVFQLAAPSQNNSGQEASLIGSSVGAGLQGVQQGLSSIGSGLASAIPFVGAAFSAIFGSLMAASQKRAAEARSENSAVAQAIPGWDAAVVQIVAAYNKGQIGASDVQRFIVCPQSADSSIPSGVGILWQNYWNEVGPHVQPDRNGCHGGADVQPEGKSWCSGSYGAGCCVAYDGLKNGCVYILQALAKAEKNPGTTVTSKTIPTIYASKYGGINRPGYAVTFKKPVSSVSSLTSMIHF